MEQSICCYLSLKSLSATRQSLNPVNSHSVIMKALVYKSTGSWYTVKNQAGRTFNARIKGIFKIDGITSTNPVAVGDEVDIEPESEIENTAIINEILDRRNYVNRQSPRQKYQHHIIAANVDQSVLFATLKEPRTSQGFIDRFLVACEMYHVPAAIVFNKADLHRNCLLYTSPSPRDRQKSRMPSSA